MKVNAEKKKIHYEGALDISVNKKRLGIDISLFATGAPCRAGRNLFKSSSCRRVVSAANTSEILCVAQYAYDTNSTSVIGLIAVNAKDLLRGICSL